MVYLARSVLGLGNGYSPHLESLIPATIKHPNILGYFPIRDMAPESPHNVLCKARHQIELNHRRFIVLPSAHTSEATMRCRSLQGTKRLVF